jgi:phosphoribosylanthranilate isomerase
MKTFVKFSGLTERAWVEQVPKGGAAGFVVDVSDSPCTLTVEAAARLAEIVPSETEVWAVSRDPAPELIHRLFDEVGVDRIQVFGAVPPDLEFLETHHIVPSVPIPPDLGDGSLPKVPTPEAHPILHLDAPGNPLALGSTIRPNWEICRGLVDAHPGRKLVLCGGLEPANVEEALIAVRPWGVDVSAGIEGSLGQKDPRKMAAFVEAVLHAEPSLP